MNPLQVVKKNISKLLVSESSMTPEERALFDWQFVVQVEGQSYLIGKTGANTMYYRKPDQEEPTVLYPDEMLNLIDEWSKQKYVRYCLCFKSTDNVKRDNLESLARARRIKPKNFKTGYVICGVTPKGIKEPLLKLQDGLNGTVWVDY